MKKLILANLKMYFNTKEEIENYLKEVNIHKNNFIVFPSVIYLDKFLKQNFICGVQNISASQSGSYTGENSALSVKNLGASYAIIGHSEVRKNFKETDEIINQKIKQALQNKLIPILCVGESLDAYHQNQTKQIVNMQISKALKDIDKEIIVSYEPVWAIGTGITPSNEEIDDIINYIKSLFKYKVKVLYGGSVSDKNIQNLNDINSVDGFLIGKSATEPSSLKKIIEVARM